MQYSQQSQQVLKVIDDETASNSSSNVASSSDPRRRTMYIKTYKSDSDDELQKLANLTPTRPQRSSKPRITDLRDQMRFHSFTGRDAGYAENLPNITVINVPSNIHNYVEQTERFHNVDPALYDEGIPISQTRPEVEPDVESSDVSDDELSSSISSLDVPIRNLINKNSKTSELQHGKATSPYCLFFRDTQTAIKSKKAGASFGEINRIVSSMWENLDSKTKNVYRKRSEALKDGTPYSIPIPVNIGSRDFVDSEVKGKKSSTKNGTTSSSRMKKEKHRKRKDRDTEGKHKKKRLKEKKQKVDIDSDELDNVSLSSCEAETNVPTASTHKMTSHNVKKQNDNDDFVTAEPSRRNNHESVKVTRFCICDGCSNLSIDDSRWDHQFCSTVCCFKHALDAHHLLFTFELAEKS